MRRPLRVMKFGGTSVGDAECIERAAKIVAAASGQGAVVVVVSAMSGVTNRLIEAAHRSQEGRQEEVAKLTDLLRSRSSPKRRASFKAQRCCGSSPRAPGTLSPALGSALQRP